MARLLTVTRERRLTMRYNPPPNWPAPPPGWVPPPQWSPDPAWPPPPPGWRLWVDDDAPSGQNQTSALRRVERTSDDVEYFGDDRAWSASSEQMPHGHVPPPSLPARPTQFAPEDLSAHHLGRAATIQWDDDNRYDIGTIVAVSADPTSIKIKLSGLETPVSFSRQPPGDGPVNPRLYLWI
ncbi:hypothetical protein [Mycobacterium sp.]|uniref:hypothetical protein n=1 Tax=Mycobacterium sp. TaxID=1785 RepID=UPI0025D47BB4|nr:hypothetical protein [Mycobacterium sp.]